MDVLVFLGAVLLLAVLGACVLGILFDLHEPELALGAVAGLLLHAYLMFLFGSLGLVPNTNGGALGMLLLLAAAAVALGGMRWWTQAIRSLNGPQLLGLGCLVAIYAGFCWIRARNPQIWGEEKFMDFAFLNGIWRSERFPPEDPWFAGGSINYYYFGYLMVADLAQLTGIHTAVVYNLALGMWFGLSFSCAYSIGRQLTGRWAYGLLAGVLLAVCGNLEGALQALNGQASNFNYFQSSRVIEFTINEFPFFSFIHADLHPHVLSIPVLLLLMSLLLCGFRHPEVLFPQRYSLRFAGRLGFLAVLLGAVPCTNMADLPTFWGLFVLAYLWIAARTGVLPRPEGQSRRVRVVPGLAALGALLIFAYLLFLPFHARFASAQVKGIGLVNKLTGFVDFLIIHGLFLYVVASEILTRPGPFDPSRPWKSREPLFVALGGLVLAILLGYDSLTLGILAVLVVAVLASVRAGWSKRKPEDDFCDLILLAAFGLLMGCEVFYIKDFYGGDYERQNTIFKFYYQAWIFLAIAAPRSLESLSRRFEGHPARRAWIGSFAILLTASLVYPVLGTRARYFRDPPANTLYGMDHLVHWHSDEHEAMDWLQKDAPRGSRLLELCGGPYQYYGRFSANTGIPTLLGWIQHEAFWRDNTYQIPREREQQVRRIYDSSQLTDDVRGLLNRFGVRYIVVGEVERREVQAEGLAKFEQLPVAFQKGAVTIYRWEPPSS
jgi:YYY domain-containing protein